MRSDYHGVVHELNSALHGLREAPTYDETDQIEPGGHFVSLVHRATRALFDQPLSMSVITSERMRRQAVVARPTDASTSLIESVRNEVFEVSSFVLQIRAAWERTPREPADAWAALVERRERWRSSELERGGILQEFLDRRAVGQFTPEDVASLYAAVMAVGTTLDQPGVVDIVKTTLGYRRVRPQVDSLSTRIKSALDLISLATDHWRRVGLEHYDHLAELHAALNSLTNGSLVFPRPCPDPLEDLNLPEACREIRSRLEEVITFVVEQLSLGPIRRHALTRLRAYLERFGGAGLVKEIAVACARKKRRTPEDALQTAIDKFLFAEGFFPITHAVAGPGRIDTFFEAHRYLFEDRAVEASLPILIELKQVLALSRNDSVTAAKLRAAIDAARTQAKQYASYLAANARWDAQDVFAVVCYNGAVRYTQPEDDVLLIYLGDALPSAGAKPLASE